MPVTRVSVAGAASSADPAEGVSFPAGAEHPAPTIRLPTTVASSLLVIICWFDAIAESPPVFGSTQRRPSLGSGLFKTKYLRVGILVPCR